MPVYIVKRPLSHDGEALAPGATVELAEGPAASLLRRGVLETAPDPAADKPGSKKPGPGAKVEA